MWVNKTKTIADSNENIVLSLFWVWVIRAIWVPQLLGTLVLKHGHDLLSCLNLWGTSLGLYELLIFDAVVEHLPLCIRHSYATLATWVCIPFRSLHLSATCLYATFLIDLSAWVSDEFLHEALLLFEVPSATEHVRAITNAALMRWAIDWTKTWCACSLSLRSLEWDRETVIIFIVTWVIFCQLSNLLLRGIFFAMLGEASVRRLVQHEVLRLNIDQVAQERREEKRAHHGDNEWEIEHDLSLDAVPLNDNRQDASFSRRLKYIIRDNHIDIKECHHDHQDQVYVLQDNKQVEVRVIVNSNAVVDPLTVVVESFHTLVALIAMSRISCADHLAAGTEQIGFKLLHKAHERDTWGASHISRLDFDRQTEEYHCSDENYE
jgi:hypothetical protein